MPPSLRRAAHRPIRICPRFGALVLGLACVVILSAAPPQAPLPVEPPPAGTTVLFDRDIFPIFEKRCIACHDAAGGEAEGKLDLATAAAVLAGGKKGPAAKAGDGAGSLVFQLSARQKKPFMPPKDEEPMTPRELGLLKAWIDQGAKPGSNLAPRAAAVPVALQSLPSGLHPIYAVDLHPSGKLAAAGRANQVFVYHVATGQLVGRLPGCGDLVQSLRFSPDGQWLAVGEYRTVRLWRTPAIPDKPTGLLAWEPAGELGPLAERVLALDFRPDSQWLACGGGVPASRGEVVVFDLKTKKAVMELKEPHTDTVFSVAFRPDGKALATAAGDKFVKVFEVPGGKLLRSFEGHTGHVLGVAWRHDGQELASASADKTLKQWNFEQGEQIRTVGGHGSEVAAVRYLPKSGQFVSACGDRHARLIHPDGNHARGFGGPSDFLHALAVSSDGAQLLAGGQDGVLFLWQMADGKPLQRWEPPKP